MPAKSLAGNHKGASPSLKKYEFSRQNDMVMENM
jgi:hypothetical protein